MKVETINIYPILFTTEKKLDIRDMPGATWRDVVAAVLTEKKEAVSLEEIYKEVELYKKAQKNQWWKEKVRQTLQYHPDHFFHAGRGLWGLRQRHAV